MSCKRCGAPTNGSDPNEHVIGFSCGIGLGNASSEHYYQKERSRRMRTTREIAQDVYTVFAKAFANDYIDAHYFLGADKKEIDKAYELLDELDTYGTVAFRKKYLEENTGENQPKGGE